MNLHLKKRLGLNAFRTLSLMPNFYNFVYRKLDLGKTERIKLFCVGLPRSGTHSIAHMFSKKYRSSHEPISGPTINAILNYQGKNYSNSEIENFLLMRDRFLNLEVEAAHYLHNVTPQLVNLFKNSKFILTVREPLSWLNSEINMNMKTGEGGIWHVLQKSRYGSHNYSGEVKYLKEQKLLYPISSYLEYYTKHLKMVTDAVPKDRLFILDTFSISDSLDQISEFAGIKITDLDMEKHHMSKGKKYIKLEDNIGKDILIQKIKFHCYEMIEERFPILRKNMTYL